jgi:hypothetical protein
VFPAILPGGYSVFRDHPDVFEGLFRVIYVLIIGKVPMLVADDIFFGGSSEVIHQGFDIWVACTL